MQEGRETERGGITGQQNKAIPASESTRPPTGVSHVVLFCSMGMRHQSGGFKVLLVLNANEGSDVRHGC